ncbi:MAG: hypothetical protein N2484_12005 [Clostridia bacterium]|nr:hypothetical protein [Clostridia bacterium]
MSKSLYHIELEKNHRWNSWMNTLDATFFQIGFVCFVPAVIIVAYLKHYTDNEMILNLPVFIANFFMSLGPLIMSFYSGRFKRKKRMTVLLGWWHRLAWLPVLPVVYFLSGNKTWIIPAFLIAYAFFYIAWSSGIIFWQELIGRALVPERLSSAMGMRESISRGVGFAASFAVMAILAKVAFPLNFLILFSISFVSWLISLFWVQQIREAPYDEISDEKPSGHFKNLLTLPVKDVSFRWFIIFILFLYGHLYVGGLYTVAGIERFKDIVQPDQLTGVMNIITTLSACFFAFAAGKITERAGKFWSFLMFVVINILLPVLMNFCYSYPLYLGLLALSGVVNVIWLVEFTTTLGFSTPERRHEYLAVISFVKLIPIVIYTNLGGFLANTFSHDAAFMTSAAFSLAALLILVFKLRPLWKAQDAVND